MPAASILSAIALAIIVLISPPSGHASAPLVVTDIRVGVTPGQTRIVFHLSDSVSFRTFTLDGPKRLVADLPAMVFKLPRTWRQQKGGLVTGFRFGPKGPNQSRIVFDLSGPIKIADSFIVPPSGERRYRLVMILEDEEPSRFQAASGWPEGEGVGADTAQAARPKRPERTQKLICLDPGHGGVDPGASGVSGTLEKTIVLDAAIKLRDLLVKSGRYAVTMTRDTDIFLSLKARVAVCRSAQADLMISIHADSAGNLGGVRGATVYTLSEKASDAEAEELARSENKSDVIAGVPLGGEDNAVSEILIDLAQRDTKLNSVRFAGVLVPRLLQSGATTERSHKFAGFRVLKAPDVPSVLLEMGYLTNAADESRLTNPVWQGQLALAILGALDVYFRSLSGPAQPQPGQAPAAPARKP